MKKMLRVSVDIETENGSVITIRKPYRVTFKVEKSDTPIENPTYVSAPGVELGFLFETEEDTCLFNMRSKKIEIKQKE